MSDDVSKYPGVSLVVPAFRSPGTLQRLVALVFDHVAPLTHELELIIVDDGSGDSTWASIVDLAARYDWVHGITLQRNYGQHNALLAGLRSASHPIIVTIDDDLQTPPDQIPVLLEALTDDFDLVYGYPAEQPQTRRRNFASVLTKRMMKRALGDDVYPRSSAFRAFRRDLLAAAEELRDPYIAIDVMLTWATTRITDRTVRFDVRDAGTSGYSTAKLVRHALNMITGYSTRPLRWMSMVGLACALVGFAALAYVLVTFFLGGSSVAGFTFLAAAITLFSGVQLMTLGLLGEYMGRMHFRSMGKPPYVVRERTRSTSPIAGAPQGSAATVAPDGR